MTDRDLDLEDRARQWPAHKDEHDTPQAGCCWCEEEQTCRECGLEFRSQERKTGRIHLHRKICVARLREERERLSDALRRLSEIAEAAPELNLCNYDEGQVEALNGAMIEVVLALRTALGKEGA